MKSYDLLNTRLHFVRFSFPFSIVSHLKFFSPLVFEIPNNCHKIFEIMLHSFVRLKVIRNLFLSSRNAHPAQMIAFKNVHNKKESKNLEGSGTRPLALKSFEN